MHLNRFARKLNNKSGNSIMMALLLLLVATVVSVVIVAVALTSTMHVTDNKQSQQEYLACVSAANMLRDGLNGSTYEYTETTGTYTYQEWNSGKRKYVDKEESLGTIIGPDDGKPRTTSDILEKYVTELSESIRTDTNESTETNFLPKVFTIEQTDENIYDVSVTSVLMYDSSGTLIENDEGITTTNYYNLKINLFAHADESSQGYRMSMTIPITEKVVAKTGTTPYNCQEKDSTTEAGTKHYTKTWVHTGFMSGYYKYEPTEHDFTTSTTTTTVTWGKATISKGWS